MQSILDRDNKLEAKAGRYYVARRVFLLLSLVSLIGFLGLMFSYKGEHVDDALPTGFWGAVFWFLLYKVASVRIQHIETIRHHRLSLNNSEKFSR